MKTLLLLAGRSRRFWPLREKSLFPLVGRSLLEHQVERLRAGGCKEIILVGGAHNLKEVRKLFPKLRTMKQKNLDLGMQGALQSSLPAIGKKPVMIVSANDVVEKGAYSALQKAAGKKGVDGVILVKKVQSYFPGGYVTVRGTRARSIVEKPGEGKEPSNLVNIVAHIHNDASLLLAALKKAKGRNDDAYEVALASLMKNHNYRIVRYEGFWQAVKYPWQLLPLLPHLLSEIKAKTVHPSAKIHRTAVIEGPVTIQRGAKVLSHATVIGPVFIGEGSVIGTNALVRAASIDRNCVIGYNCEIKASVLAANVWAHMTYLGDSIIGENVAFGGGCVTGNFRLDEGEVSSAPPPGSDRKEKTPTGLMKFGAVVGENCRMGIKVGMNPGVKIGAGCFVAGGTFLSEDVPEKSFVSQKDGQVHTCGNKSHIPAPMNRNGYRKRAF